MKIRKFNESNSDKLDEEYLSFIFSEFIDNKSIIRNYKDCGGDYTHLLSGNLSNEDNW